jgi:hypothetical protein
MQEAELERQYQANLSMRDEVLQLQRQLADKTATTDAEIEALVTAVTMVSTTKHVCQLVLVLCGRVKFICPALHCAYSMLSSSCYIAVCGTCCDHETISLCSLCSHLSRRLVHYGQHLCNHIVA